MLVSQGTDRSNRMLFFYGGDGRGLGFTLFLGSRFVVNISEGSIAGWQNDVFRHVAVVREGNIWSLYVDGQVVASETVSVTYPDFTGDLTFGVQLFFNVSPLHLAGDLDEMEIHGQALSGSEILGIFNASSAGKCKVTSVPFSGFAAELGIDLDDDDAEFELEGTFTLGDTNNGIDPTTEPVTLEVGTFSVIIPEGSFLETDDGFEFEGVIGGAELEVTVTPLFGTMFALEAEVEGADLAGTADPVQITLTVGDDTGTTTVDADTDESDRSGKSSKKGSSKSSGKG